ncbi:MAG: ABC transporter substrate-binding protein [Myxococcales bacterium]|nr:ABC transporter substrate-binding protein [Myxococcales bacterium]
MIRRILFFATLVPHLAIAKHPAVERSEGFIASLLKVKPDDGKLSAADKAANEKVFTQLDGYFDFDRLTAEPISPRADKFTPAEKAEFQKKFRELIRLVAYPDSGGFFRRAKYTLADPKEEGEVVTVQLDAKVVKDDLETKVDLHWKKMGDVLKLVDVSFDGDSLVKDYTNQFVRIIDKEGAKGLIAKVDKRRAELDAPKAK